MEGWNRHSRCGEEEVVSGQLPVVSQIASIAGKTCFEGKYLDHDDSYLVSFRLVTLIFETFDGPQG
jgi:hypothetical protein